MWKIHRRFPVLASYARTKPFSFLRLFGYITFRGAGAFVTALALSLWLGPKVIAWLKRLKFGQHYADKAEESGGLVARITNKKGTPTMGGFLIIMVMDISALLWAQWNTLVQLTLLSVLVLAGLARCRAGAVCAVYAQRSTGDFVTGAAKDAAEAACVETGLESLLILAAMDRQKRQASTDRWRPSLWTD